MTCDVSLDCVVHSAEISSQDRGRTTTMTMMMMMTSLGQYYNGTLIFAR